ncbi:50S ribosomal protein L33 [Acanthopleuribacter pedis]|uniref:Large ribosomal subunit protein bL33 n=1 Tax=Acanthopleuribacter pedis TaxID=442870 RepID=A0A8J7Q673_9BACT|nr:50S ribosomal protein L33 [Acanthopleuribacter pedis]
MAKAKKGNRINILVECTEARKEGKPPSRYSTSKSRRNTPSRLEIKKYNPFLKRHTVHKEVR